MDVSVIFATHNREDVLGAVFECWRKVHAATKYEYEIICSDDESTDGTVGIIEGVKDLPIVLIKNPKGGAGPARNAALKIARGKIIIFTGDDMFPREDFINRHFENYLKYGDSVATLGRIDWHSSICLNHLMRHITEIGCEQFGFIALPSYQLIDFRHFYTSNISVSKKLLDMQETHFSSQFDKYGFEDIELGYRLQKDGMKMIYDPDIVIEHHHIYESVEKFCTRQQNAGEELVVFNDMHDDLENKCICDIDNCKDAFQKYAAHHKLKFSVGGILIQLVVYMAKRTTQLLEKRLKSKGNSRLEKICSVLYADLFQYYFFYGCSVRMNEDKKLGKRCVSQFAYQYLKKPFSQIYWDMGYGYNEGDSRKWKCWDDSDIVLEKVLPPNVSEIRVSPLKDKCIADIHSIKFEKQDGSLEDADIFWHNACRVEQSTYDFTNTIDPQIVINKIEKSYIKIIAKMRVREMRKRGIIRAMKRIVKKCLSWTGRKIEKEEAWHVNYSYGQPRRIQIAIGGSDTVKRSELLKKYQEAVAFLGGNVCISDVGHRERGYIDYIYSPRKRGLEKNQFVQAVYTLLNNSYDYLLVSGGLEEFPYIVNESLEDGLIYSALINGETIEEICQHSVGKFLRLPAYVEINNTINLRDIIPEIQKKGNAILECYSRCMPEYRISNRGFSYNKEMPVAFILLEELSLSSREKNKKIVQTMRSLCEQYKLCIVVMEKNLKGQEMAYRKLEGICEHIFALKEISEYENYLDILYELRNIFNPDCVWICNKSGWAGENLQKIYKVYDGIPVSDLSA